MCNPFASALSKREMTLHRSDFLQGEPWVYACLIFTVILAYGAPLLARGAGGSGYHKVQEIVLGGEGGWDYLTLDAAARRLYIARATQVVVIDPDAGKVVGTILDTPGVHGIALARRAGDRLHEQWA